MQSAQCVDIQGEVHQGVGRVGEGMSLSINGNTVWHCRIYGAHAGQGLEGRIPE